MKMLILLLKFLTLAVCNERGAVDLMGGTEPTAAEGGGSAGGTGGTSEGDPGTGGGNGGAGGEPKVEYKYPESLDKSFHGNPTLLRFAKEDGSFDMGNVMKSLIHANGMVGADKMAVPNKNFTDEQWNQAYRKMGLPEKLEDYKVTNNLPEGLNANDAFLKDFVNTAHTAGVAPKQAQKILDFFNTAAGNQVKTQNDMAQVDADKQYNELKTEWGEAFDGNVQLAGNALHQFTTPEEFQYLKDSGIANDPMLTRIFNKIGKGLMEDTFAPEAKGGMGMTKEDIKTKIRDYYKEDHPFMNPTHPENAHYMDEFMKLQTLLHGSDKA